MDQLGYIAIIAGAIGVHIDRERVRRGLWKDYEAKDQFNQIKIKGDRILRSYELLEETMDDEVRDQITESIVAEAFDVINYTVFGVRQLEGTV